MSNSLFRGKYRVESARLKHWDYSAPGWYFVTICTDKHRCWLGEVRDGRVVLSESGTIVAEEWQRTAGLRPSITLDQWVIMPNHLHGIVVIQAGSGGVPVEAATLDDRSKSRGIRPNSLGSIIGQVKSVCTKRIRAAGIDAFGWQERYYEHIIRDEASLADIREYIVNNPRKWDLDQLNPTTQQR